MGVISRVSIPMSHIIGDFRTPLITAHEPPSRACFRVLRCRGFGLGAFTLGLLNGSFRK